MGAGSAREGVRMGDAQFGRCGDWEDLFAGRARSHRVRLGHGVGSTPTRASLDIGCTWHKSMQEPVIVGAGSAREGVRMGGAQFERCGDWEYVFAGRARSHRVRLGHRVGSTLTGAAWTLRGGHSHRGRPGHRVGPTLTESVLHLEWGPDRGRGSRLRGRACRVQTCRTSSARPPASWTTTWMKCSLAITAGGSTKG